MQNLKPFCLTWDAKFESNIEMKSTLAFVSHHKTQVQPPDCSFTGVYISFSALLEQWEKACHLHTHTQA